MLPALLALLWVPVLPALEGDVAVRDPSTIIESNGRYYTVGTGAGLPIFVSDDGWTWQRAGTVLERVRGGRAGEDAPERGGDDARSPNLIRIRDRFLLYYSAAGERPEAAVGLLTATTLDPSSPDYGWTDAGLVEVSALDPGVFLDPADGRLWLTYGSEAGDIRLVELDPATGQRLDSDAAPIAIAAGAAAPIMIYRDGWYYLLVTHGSCCRGASSTSSIRVGRARSVQGPFIDPSGSDMLHGGGGLFVGSGGRRIGPGHFGVLDAGDGVQKFSLHYEADLDRGGSSVLDIRPLLWRDGWPVAGDHLRAGIYQIESARTGTALGLAVAGVPVGGSPGRGSGGRGGGAPVADQSVMEASAGWPSGAIDLRLSPYMLQAQQKWAITPVGDVGGYPGSPYFKITIADSGRTLAATAERELVTLPSYSGVPAELWRIEQLTDGSYRIMPKSMPGSDAALALSAAGGSMPTLDPFDPASDRQRWTLKAP